MRTRKKSTTPGSAKVGSTSFEVGSGNVFADLGFIDAEERVAKARLASEINDIIEARGWTQEQAAAHLNTHQPVISALHRGRLSSITYDRLVGWLVLLDRSVEIRVQPAKPQEAHVKVAVTRTPLS